MTEEQKKIKRQFQTQTRLANVQFDRLEDNNQDIMEFKMTLRHIEKCIEKIEKEFNL